MTRRPVILVTRRLDPASHQRMSRDYEAVLNETDKSFSSDELAKLCQHVDGVIACNGEQFSAKVISEFPPRMRVIACSTYSAGMVDLEAARSVGVIVTHSGDPSLSPKDASRTLDAVDAVFKGYAPPDRLA